MIWLIGTGPMAREYARVLVASGLNFSVVGRDGIKAQNFAKEFQGTTSVASVLSGGVEQAIDLVVQGRIAPPTHAIVAVPVDRLAAIATMLAPHCPSILLEKPGALEVAELKSLIEHPAIRSGICRIMIGYNRRFLESIEYVRQRIMADGPVLSAVLEFDEPIPRIEDLPTDPAIKARWGYANASHVFDLLFYLCGPSVAHHAPGTDQEAKTSDPHLPWHPSASVFVGAGLTSGGTRYVYHGNYASVGRWRLALSMRRKRYLLMPLEGVQVVEGGSVVPKDVILPPSEPGHLKPGLKGQVDAFLASDRHDQLASLAYQVWHLTHLATVFGYPK